MADIQNNAASFQWLENSSSADVKGAEEREALKQFAGTSSTYYYAAKRRLAASKTPLSTFNTACAIFGPAWAAWRRLWLNCTLIALVDLFVLVFVARSLWLEPDNSSANALWLGIVLFIAARCMWGLAGNLFFFERYTRWRSNRTLPAGTNLTAALGASTVIAFITGLIVYRFSFANVPSFITDFPTHSGIASASAGAIDEFVFILTVKFGVFFDSVTAAVQAVLGGLKTAFVDTPWPVMVLLILLIAWRTGGVKVTLFTAGAILYIGLFGFWESTMDTLSLVAGSVLICVLLGLPMGIWCANSARVNTVVSPVLDLMQTMPSFVYLIPAIAFFSVGRVPAVLATVVFAMPPMIRLTALGIRQVPRGIKESALAFGATPAQVLLKVDLPLSLPSIMTGLNQTIMMSLAMVVIAALIGAGGLGFQVLFALQQVNAGKGLLSGLAIVVCAMTIDRMVQIKYDNNKDKNPVGPGPKANKAGKK